MEQYYLSIHHFHKHPYTIFVYDLNDNESDLIEEEFLIDYVGGYMFQDCLSVRLSYKNKDGSPDRDILPENSIFLTLSLKNLGDYGLNSLF